MIDFLNHEYSNNFDITFITGKKYYDDYKNIEVSDNVKIEPFMDNLINLLNNYIFLSTFPSDYSICYRYYRKESPMAALVKKHIYD